MSTKKLAKELGIIRKRSLSSGSHTNNLSAANQLFSYLIIIDFESTCWREKNNHGQEIIEFPAVLMNTHTGQIESEFHLYVQPQEHPLLSSFCKELTGITQEQVEAGLPLQICLSKFTRWLHTLQQEKGVVFLPDNTHTTVSGKPCAFLTWSDWDLGVCLQYECNRKQITKPEALNSWIDLRATYRIFYQRKPKGLNGALQDLGIQFSGREHSGLDDARNTARLAWRMIKDGCNIKITKSRSREPVKSRVSSRVCANSHVCNESKKNQPKHTSVTHTELHSVTSSHTSLVSLRTVLSSINPMHNLPVSHTSDPDVTNNSYPDSISDWSEEFVLAEFGESGSYDDVILDDVSEGMPHDSTSPVDKKTIFDSNPPYLFKDSIRSLKEHNITPPTVSFSVYNDQTHHSSSVFFVPSSIRLPTCNQSARRSLSVNSSTHNQSPHSFNTVHSDESRSFNQSVCHSVTVKQSALSCISVNQSSRSSIPVKQTPPSCSVNQSALSSCKQLPVPPSRGRAEATSCIINNTIDTSAIASISGNQSAHASVSINQSAFSVSSSKQLPRLKGGIKITAPLCDCGRRSKRLTVCNGGPNHGRAFYACTGRRNSGHTLRDSTNVVSTPCGNGCGFFKWESVLIKSSSGNRNTSALSFNLTTPASRNFR